MPLPVSNTAPSLAIRRSAFERADLTRQEFDEALGLTADEFRVEADLIVIGPLVGESSLTDLIDQLEERGITLPPGPVHADGFGDSPELSEALLELIRIGRKRAGTGLLWAYEHDAEHIAKAGDIEIVVDHLHRPAVVTRIVSSEIVAFNEVTAEYAAIEGEGDGSLEYWRKAHWAFFSRECTRVGRAPSESMPVICCVFEVLDVVPSQNAA